MINAVTLSGGGAYGAFEVGVLKALMQGHAKVTGGEPLDPLIFTGTSAGAYIAAVLLSVDAPSPGDRVRHLERVWLEDVMENPKRGGNGCYYLRFDPRRYIDPARFTEHPTEPMRLVAEDLRFFAATFLGRVAGGTSSHEPLERKVLELFDLSSMVSTEPFRELVKRTVSIEMIRNSGRKISIAATNWKTGELVIFETPSITLESVMASAAIPGIFPAIEIAGEPYMDGGILMNTPLRAAIHMGADVVHAVALDQDIKNVPPASRPNTLDTIERLLNLTNSSRIETDLKLADAVNKSLPKPGRRKVQIHIHRPLADMGGVFGMLNFSSLRMRQMIEQGYREAVTHDCTQNGCVL